MQPLCTLMYIDVLSLQRHRLVDMGFVHCRSAFQMPMHSGTSFYGGGLQFSTS